MNRLPEGCLEGCLFTRKVACFSCAEWHGEIRQLSMKTLVNIGVAWLPALATCLPLGNRVLPLGCLEGCL